MKKKIGLKDIILLQLVVMIYTVSTIIGKFAAGAADDSLIKFVLLYGAEIGVLGIYAILWQQMIKRFDLSVAYANRAMALLWSAVWAVVLFHENLTGKQLIGIALVIIGTVIVNADQSPAEKKEEERA